MLCKTFFPKKKNLVTRCRVKSSPVDCRGVCGGPFVIEQNTISLRGFPRLRVGNRSNILGYVLVLNGMSSLKNCGH